MRAFVSHLTKDRKVAGRIKSFIASFGFEAFLAHEDVGVSEEWRTEILDGLGRADVFIAILSQGYFGSAWCSQEFGIAAFRKIPIIPLALDETIPTGFGGHIQSKRITPDNFKGTLIRALKKQDEAAVIDGLIKWVGDSTSFDEANYRFQLLEPCLADATPKQLVSFLETAASNSQVYGAYDPRAAFPKLLRSQGKLLSPKTRTRLEDILG